ncbi:MAG: hypothetical protein HY301_15160 [Verrucomicrobia bacterium]|nr:hypothetical protein [Verrucomicrobiota bacterium]
MKRKRSRPSLLRRAELVMKNFRKSRTTGEVERSFIALALAATPEERWEINQFLVSRLPLVARRAMEQESDESALAHARLQGFR